MFGLAPLHHSLVHLCGDGIGIFYMLTLVGLSVLIPIYNGLFCFLPIDILFEKLYVCHSIIANKRLLNDSFVRRLLPVSIPGYPNICTLQHTNNEASGRFLQLIVGLYKRRFPKYILKILLMSQQLFAGTKKE